MGAPESASVLKPAPALAGAGRSRAAAQTLAANSAAFALSAIAGLLVARFVGPTGKGMYGSVQVLVSLFAALPAGMSSAVAYYVIRKRRELSNYLPALAIVLLGVVGLAWATLALWRLHSPVGAEFVAFAAVLPAAAIVGCQYNLYLSFGLLRRLNRQHIGLALGTLLCVVIALWPLRSGTQGALAGWIVCTYVAAAVVVIQVFKLRTGSEELHIRQALRALLRRGGVSSLHLSVSSLSYNVDALLVIGLAGTAAFGLYSVALGATNVLGLISRSAGAVVMRDIGARDLTESARLTVRTARIVTLVVFAGAAFMFFAGPPLIKGFLGPRFDGSITPLRILLPGMIAFAGMGVFSAFFVYQLGRPGTVLMINLVMTLLQAVLCFVLIPRFGINGAALGSSIGYVAGIALHSALLCKATGLKLPEVWVIKRGDLTGMLRGAWSLRIRWLPRVGEPDDPLATQRPL